VLSLSIGLNCGNVAASGSSPNTAALTTTNGASKVSNITISGSPALNGSTDSSGQAELVRANQSASGKKQFEVKATSLPAVNKAFVVGIDDGTTTLGPTAPSTEPGANTNTGVILSMFVTGSSGFAWAISKGSAFGGGGTGSTNLSLNDVITVEFDTTPGGASDTVSFYLNGTQLGSTVTGLGTITTAAYAVMGCEGQATFTANFGQNTFTHALSSGYTAYGS
jgi:hypothetical protein